MLALILQLEATPMHIGSSRLPRCTVLAGMTIRPRADFGADQFRIEVFAAGHDLHFGGDGPRAGGLKLRHE